MPTIRTFLQEDLDRLQTVLACLQAADPQDRGARKALLASVRDGLSRHITCEESLLFPLMEQRVGSGAFRPLAVMRREHQGIHQYLDRMEAAVEVGTSEREAATDLLATLALHRPKEERLLGAWLDALLDPETTADVKAQMHVFLPAPSPSR